MLIVHEYLSTVPFDLYELHLFHLVVRHGSFTKAAEVAGLTQSAISRQVQGMEAGLGVALLERTTRRVQPTDAGQFLYEESARLLGNVEQSLQRLREDFAGARKEIRVGVSRSVALAHLPGLFHANLRRSPQVACRVSCRTSSDILSALETNELDLGVICPPPHLPRTVRKTHHFDDAFTAIAPAGEPVHFAKSPVMRRRIKEWVERQPWLLLDESSNTGQQLRGWIRRQGWKIDPVMQLDGFDLIINLVSLGMGVSLVPIRALALYGQKRTIQRIQLPDRFVRELVVVMRQHRKASGHLNDFITNVLF